MSSEMKEVRIGLLGLGTVGAGVVKILESRRAMLEERAGCRLTLAAVADTDLTRPREGLDLAKLPMTPDAGRVLADPSIHIVVELVGGLEPARSFIMKALGAGKHVVTVKEGLVAHRIQTVFGIVNGTSNYILSKMTDEGLDFSMVLKEAQAAGYAEADPTLDTEGITRVTQQDIGYARELGYRIKLLAIAKAADGGVEVRVHPTMIPAGSPLAAVSGVFNAVFVTGDAVGDLMFYGRGAGQLPTASAVWADALELARRIAHGIPALALELPSVGPAALPLRPMETIRCCYYLRVMAQDKPGVLSRVAGILGENDISIANVIQKGRGTREAIPVVIVTHEARERDMRAALTKIDRLRDVAGATTMIRVEGPPA